MFMSPDEFPLPWEYRDWTFDGLVGAPPDDVDERTIVFLDCGNIDRMPVDFLQADGLHILNIDHHHDNTRFGTVNLVVAGGLLHGRDRLATSPRSSAPRSRRRSPTRSTSASSPTPASSCTRTRRAEAHRMAAELIEAGVEPHQVYRRLYEDLPFRRLQLLQRALASVERHDDGAITIAHLVEGRLRGDRRPGDRLRGHRRPHARRRGHRRRRARARAAGRRPPGHAQGQPARHRRPRGRVADRARARRRRPPAGGRLHDRRCPTASSSRSCASRSARSSAERERPAGVPLPEAGRGDLPRRRRARCAAGCRAARRSATPGTLDPFATGLLLVLVGRATRAQRFLMALPKTYRAVARLGWTSDTGDRDGELEQTGRVPERPRAARPAS